MRDTYFHEDDYCQLELTPSENAAFCAKQMGEIEKFADEHKSGVGWTDMFARTENPTPLSALLIRLDDLKSVLPTTMTPYDRVLTGYASYRTTCDSTFAFGPDHNLVLFAESPDDVVTSIWFTLDLATVDDVNIALAMATSLAKWPAIIADWGWSALLQLDNNDELAAYFNKRREVWGRTNAENGG